MGAAHGFAFAAAQAVFHGFGDFAQVRLLHNQAFKAEQLERRRVGMAQIGTAHKFVAVEAALRVDFGFVIPKRLHFFIGQKLQFGDADAVFARNHAVQAAGNPHNPRHGLMRGLQHFVIVRIHGDVGVDVAVARVHVQRDKHAAAHGLGVDFAQARHDFGVRLAGENFRQRLHHVLLYRHAQPEIAKGNEAALLRVGFGCGMGGVAVTRLVFGQRRVQIVQQPFPALLHGGDMGECVSGAFPQKLGGGQVGVHFVHWQAA